MSLSAAVRLAWLVARVRKCAQGCVCVCVCVHAWKTSSLSLPCSSGSSACDGTPPRRVDAPHVSQRARRRVDAGVVTALGRRRRHHEVFADVRARLHRHQHLARRCGRLAGRRARGVRVDVLRCRLGADQSQRGPGVDSRRHRADDSGGGGAIRPEAADGRARGLRRCGAEALCLRQRVRACVCAWVCVCVCVRVRACV